VIAEGRRLEGAALLDPSTSTASSQENSMTHPQSTFGRRRRSILEIRISQAENFLVVHAGWTRERVRRYLDAARQVWNEPQAVLQLEELVRYERSQTATKKPKYAIPVW